LEACQAETPLRLTTTAIGHRLLAIGSAKMKQPKAQSLFSRISCISRFKFFIFSLRLSVDSFWLRPHRSSRGDEALNNPRPTNVAQASCLSVAFSPQMGAFFATKERKAHKDHKNDTA
jgi:hypothetical protein